VVGGLVAVPTILVDQATKSFARLYLPSCDDQLDCGELSPDPISFVRVENAGSVGGWAQGLEIWTIVAALALVGLFFYGRARPDRGLSVAWGLAFGGAAGNLIDRLAFGGVTDFIRFAPFGSLVIFFNIADVALAVGSVGLSIALYRGFASRAG
jgi:signal peptidase II